MKIPDNTTKANFIKNLSISDYRFHVEYYRDIDAKELFRLWQCASTRDKIEIVSITGLNGYYFMLNGRLSVDCMMTNENGKFQIYELLLKKFNEYEEMMLAIL